VNQGQDAKMAERKTTHFGYREVAEDDKARLVGGVFDSVAGRYDLMNDLMSGGIHRLWKRFAIELSGARAGHRVLDVAGGTGDLAARFARAVGDTGRVVLTDINASMLAVGRDRLLDEGLCGNIDCVLANAEALPFAESSFDCVSIAFGLRNVTHKERALESMLRVLRPGGRLLVLEFSRPTSEFLGRLYDAYSFGVIPKIGKLVTGDEDSYRYLAESIRMHPDQETLRDMLEDAGFERCDYHNLTGGIVAVHRGFKAAA
jgi:demethylmenaquinone methyltransferase/2-methoxy-6-polyprenyl-1,4-benzoquinol methylase